ncbi:MAG: hypothetical protein VX700_13055 [Pseudomonadota bacterium]|nr:hypothetical protein [Pseudomonadota bacterium]
MKKTFDRQKENIGNVIALEHINICVPDQRLATLFYVSGLGLTRDPYLVTSVTNMWVNIGRNQFHMPTRDPMIVRGTIGIVIPERHKIIKRLKTVKKALKDTNFSFKAEKGYVAATCPWGNRFRIYSPGKRFGRMALGIAFIEFDVPQNTAKGIAKFYREIVSAPARIGRSGSVAAHVQVGDGQELIFRETTKEVPAFDGHHIQIYIADFSGPYEKLWKRGLISEESSQYQYRFEEIVDPDTDEVLYTLDHEMRSLTHPLFARPLVNRNPDQTNNSFGAGHENQSWALPYSG